jgi:hypothetical protein
MNRIEPLARKIPGQKCSESMKRMQGVQKTKSQVTGKPLVDTASWQHAARASVLCHRSNGCGPIPEGHLAARAAKGKVIYFGLKLEVARSEKLPVKWRGQSCCANERELQLQVCASHFMNPPRSLPTFWALFMSFTSAPIMSVMHL